jgi:hypothetical protein
MRKIYEEDITRCRSDNTNRPLVLSFDYAQNVQFPYKPEQPGSWYFISMKKIYQFGIVNEELDTHFHLLYSDEDTGKGPDEVSSLLWWFLENSTIRKSRNLIFWADNCGGQNKNNTIVHLMHYLVRIGMFDSVQLKFQIKGHTRNSVDRGFAYTKKLFNRSEVYSIECFRDVIKRSCSNHTSLHDSDQKMFPVVVDAPNVFKHFTKKLQGIYQKFNGIQKYHIFKIEKGNDNVFAFSVKDKKWDAISILLPRNKICDTLELIPIHMKGPNKERMIDFYYKIRPEIPDEFKDSLCPKPKDEVETEVKELKSKRVQTYKDRKNKKINGNS